MKLRILDTLEIVGMNFLSLFKIFRRERVPMALILALALLLLAIFFAFLAFAPVLSPFIYPLF